MALEGLKPVLQDLARSRRSRDLLNNGYQSGGNSKPQPLGPGPALAQTYIPQYFEGLRGALGAVPEVTATPIKGLSPDFYTAQRNQMKEALRQDFFGPLGTVQQTASNESAAGRLGSGVGRTVIAESALRPFAQGAVAIDQNVLQGQLQEQAQTRQFNAANALDAAKTNATLKSDYNNLMAQLYIADKENWSQEAIAQLEAEVIMFEARAKERSARSSTDVELINAQINYLNSIGQFKPFEGSPAGDVASGLAAKFGASPTSKTNSSQTKEPTGPPQEPGRFHGQISPDGMHTWNARSVRWVPIY